VCESFAAESLDDFQDLETYLLEQMEEEFKDQLGDYVELMIWLILISKSTKLVRQIVV
jgi:hypothetical protein